MVKASAVARKWHSLSIGAKIVLWMTAAFGIAVIISSAMLYESVRGSYYRQTAVALSMLADGHAQSIRGWVTSIKGDVAVTVRSIEMGNGDVIDALVGKHPLDEGVKRNMEDIASSVMTSRTLYGKPVYTGVAFLKPDGTIMDYFPANLPFRMPGGFALSVRNGVALCNPYYDESLLSYAMFVGGPIHTKDGAFAGAIVFRVNLGFLDKMVSTYQGLGNYTADVYLVSSDGAILTQSQAHKFVATRGMKAEYDGARKALTTRTGGWSVYPSYHGESVIGSWSWIPDAEWAVMAEAPTGEVRRDVLNFIWFPFLALTFSGLLAMMLIYWIVRRVVTRPVKALARVTSRLADGDLTQEVRVSRSDEIGELQMSLRSLIDNLKDAIASLRRMAEEGMKVSNTLAEASQRQATSVTERSAAVTEVSTTMTELSHSAERIATQARSIVEQVKESGNQSEVGNRAVQRSVAGIQVLQEKVRRLAQRIEQLESNSEKIAGIVGVIRKIADETHILALNAAIESAAAGEYGRRFAVVAEEVKRLSEETMHAAGDINVMIGDMQASTKSAVLATEELSKEAEQDVVLIQQAGIAINGIVKRMNEIENLSESISQATEQQQVASEQMTEALKQISDVMKENVESSSKLAEMSEQLLRTSREWLRSFERFILPEDVEKKAGVAPSVHEM